MPTVQDEQLNQEKATLDLGRCMAKSILALILQFLVGQVLGKLSISGTREVSGQRDEMPIAESKNKSHGNQKNLMLAGAPRSKAR